VKKQITKFMTATEARKQLYKIIDECATEGTSFVLTKRDKAVRVIDEKSYQAIVLSRRFADNPDTLKTIKKAVKELSRA
jgi:hypothetical protein